MGDAEPADGPAVPLALEPREVLAPGYEVVYLLDVDAPEPLSLARELLASLADRPGPDLRGDDGLVAAALQSDMTQAGASAAL